MRCLAKPPHDRLADGRTLRLAIIEAGAPAPASRKTRRWWNRWIR
jgi:hypothetical protein